MELPITVLVLSDSFSHYSFTCNATCEQTISVTAHDEKGLNDIHALYPYWKHRQTITLSYTGNVRKPLHLNHAMFLDACVKSLKIWKCWYELHFATFSILLATDYRSTGREARFDGYSPTYRAVAAHYLGWGYRHACIDEKRLLQYSPLPWNLA